MDVLTAAEEALLKHLMAEAMAHWPQALIGYLEQQGLIPCGQALYDHVRDWIVLQRGRP